MAVATGQSAEQMNADFQFDEDFIDNAQREISRPMRPAGIGLQHEEPPLTYQSLGVPPCSAPQSKCFRRAIWKAASNGELAL